MGTAEPPDVNALEVVVSVVGAQEFKKDAWQFAVS